MTKRPARRSFAAPSKSLCARSLPMPEKRALSWWERYSRPRNQNFGYNAETGVYEDLVKAGVIDPTKVTRTALENAASIAGLLLTTEAMVVEIPEPKVAGPSRRLWKR